MIEPRRSHTGRIMLGKLTGEIERTPGAGSARTGGFYAPIEAPFPEARVLRWTPEDAEPHRPTHDVALVITQDVFRRVNRHLGSTLDRELGGFLLGNRYRCPNTDREYVVVDQCAKARMTESNEVHLAFTLDTWAHLAEELSGKFYGKLVVGWYHSHPRMDVFLSTYDVALHEERFAASWMTALVVEPERNRGGFFRWHAGRLNPRMPSEFFELVGRGEDGTIVDWTNHVSAGGLRPEPSSSMPALRHTSAVEAVASEPPPAPSRMARAARSPLACGVAGLVLGAALCAASVFGVGAYRDEATSQAAPVAAPSQPGKFAPLDVGSAAAEQIVETQPETAPAIDRPANKAAHRPRAKRTKVSAADPMLQPKTISTPPAVPPPSPAESAAPKE